MPACRKCGAAQAERTAFCTTCGAVMDRPDTAVSTPSPTAAVPQPTAATAPPVAAGQPPPSPIKSTTAPPEIGDVGVYIARRLTALVFDIFGAGFLIAVGVFAAATALQDRINGANWTLETVLWPAVGAAILLYFVIAEGLFGATLGKGLVGLGVMRADGTRIGMGRAFIRNLIKPLDLCAIGFALATVTSRRQRLGDFVSGTLVANSRMGRLAPLVAVALTAAVSWVAFGWADGARASQQLVQLARAEVARL
jgi:uncharacterized RDD family membrane protein YckC